MKTKIFRIGKRTLSVVLSLMMIVSTMLVGMVSVNAANISYWTVYGTPDNWSNTNNDSLKINGSNGSVTYDRGANAGSSDFYFRMVAHMDDGTEHQNNLGDSEDVSISENTQYTLQWDKASKAIKFWATKRYLTFHASSDGTNNYIKVTQSDGDSSVSYGLIGSVSSNGTQLSWTESYDSSLKFDSSNTLTITADVGEQFRLYGSNGKNYGSVNSSGSAETTYISSSGGTYTTKQDVSHCYQFNDAGTYTIELTDSSVPPTIKVSSVTTTSMYALTGSIPGVTSSTWDNYSNGHKVDTLYSDNIYYTEITTTGEARFRITSSTNSYVPGNYDSGKIYLTLVANGASDTAVVRNSSGDNKDNYYVIAEAGTYKVYIDQSGSTPKVWITSSSGEETGTPTGYYLYSATDSNGSGSATSDSYQFYDYDPDDGKFSFTTALAEGTYYFSVQGNSKKYYGGGEIDLNSGSNHGLYTRGDSNTPHAEFVSTGGVYKISIKLSGDNTCYIYIDSAGETLAESVSLTIKEPNGTAGTSLTLDEDVASTTGFILTTTFTTKVADTSSAVTYTFEYLNTNGIVKTVTKTYDAGTTEVTHSLPLTTSKDHNYSVRVSTNASYESNNQTLAYASVTSNPVSLDVKAAGLYLIPIVNKALGTPIDISNKTSYAFTLASGNTTEFILSSKQSPTTTSVKDYSVDSSRNAYCNFESKKILIDDEHDYTKYALTPNTSCSNPTLYIDNSGDQPVLYAVATYTQTTEKTMDSSKTVTYYFAEAVDDKNDSLSGDGLAIAYWNNSIHDIQLGDTAKGKIVGLDKTKHRKKVTNPVNVNNSNTIYVNTDELYGVSGGSDNIQFKIYSVDLPVWATSFAFLKTYDTTNQNDVLLTASINDSNSPISSVVLNPNRVYLYYNPSNGGVYCKPVVLDDSLWTQNKATMDVGTKTFKANAVNYHTQYETVKDNSWGRVVNDFNKWLSERFYTSSYKNPLYMGYFDKGTADNTFTGFEIENNLAIRNSSESDERYYFASVQGLANSKLSNTNKNKNGYGYILSTDGTKMPLFDYNALTADRNAHNNTYIASAVHEGLNFPFNESTFNGVTTYSYDSTSDKNRLISNGDFKVDSYTKATIGDTQGLGYFPFGSGTYGFSTEIDIDFYMSNTGYLKSDTGNQDIAFNFSGDDDVWVFVDGVLVLDLGGDHKASAGTINFSDMKVYYKSAVKNTDKTSIHDSFAIDDNYVTTVSLSDIFEANGIEFKNDDASTKHTLQMFYMERGSFDSNCSISFNLPQNNGILVKNDVIFDNVNEGLKNITKDVANRDYFSYRMGGKYAESDDCTKALALATGNALPAIADASSTNFFSSIYNADNPKYPLSSSNSVVRRIINGKEYTLLIANNPPGESSIDADTYKEAYDDASAENEYYWFNDINYSHPDSNAFATNVTEGTDGSTEVSGRTDKGYFPLLFGQSAQFESKIPSNALVQLYQEDTLYSVNTPENAAISKGSANGRNVKDYYTTAYTITDDKSGNTIGNRDAAINSGDVLADDSTDIFDAFYYSNYSGVDSTTSYAMTVAYKNYVAVGDIKITKALTDGTASENDKFRFILKLSNIFGDSTYNTMQEYSELRYNVYNADDSIASSNLEYGTAGIILKAGQYAIVSGVPVGTEFEITEASKAGYKLESQTTINTYGTGNSIPIITQSNATTPVVIVDFVNLKSAIEVNLKYYDRDIVDGTPSHISSTATTFYYAVPDSVFSKYVTYDDNGEITSVNYEGLIAQAGIENPISNVVDEYYLWGSNKDASDAIKEMYRTNDDKKNNKTYAQKYPDANFTKHTSYVGSYDNYTDATGDELWVTYYKADGTTVSDEELLDTPSLCNEITKVVAWYYNALKPYTVKVYTPYEVNDNGEFVTTNGPDLTLISKDPALYVADNFNGSEYSTYTFYYNQRFGSGDNDGNINSAGSYLEQYGLTGYLGVDPMTTRNLTYGGNDLEFRYWAYDRAGKSIASTSIDFGYRITNGATLYPIYGLVGSDTEKGLSVSKNDTDVYYDSNGKSKTRLNIMFNPYGYPDNDENIKEASIIYLVVNDEFNADNLATTIATIKDKFDGEDYTLGTNQKIPVDGITFDNKNKAANVYVYDVIFALAEGAEDVASNEVLLTNKNRVQFTTTYTTSNLAGKRIIALAAMKYENEDGEFEWIFSDNYVEYNFNENGAEITA